MQYPNPLIPGFSPDPSVALVDGVDPDLAWDDDGTAYVTCSGLSTSGEQAGRHLGIQRVRDVRQAGVLGRRLAAARAGAVGPA